MQQFITSDKFQDPFKSKTRHSKEADVYKPSPEVMNTLLAYAAALRIFKTKCAGNINILMN
jgi:hypothetical protein